MVKALCRNEIHQFIAVLLLKFSLYRFKSDIFLQLKPVKYTTDQQLKPFIK
ncbi:hypothetical protein MuYL_4865 [Mucilaginibacter xinganensis]|uniref:Uncharacterized protein n=1 Tax=Mucilaginibacter xinganensis TaxID=1234841 RepID=A0A223P4I4_9SPHI|nr:hypothetical protein MuYL_4865 [Mucilaginibacter xinganensis]